LKPVESSHLHFWGTWYIKGCRVELEWDTVKKDLNYAITTTEVEALDSRELQTLVKMFKAILKEVSNGEVKNW
jgi:hypothetical protein